MRDEARHPDLSDLSAWLDGELDEARAAEVERAVERDEALARARRETLALGRLLDAHRVPEPAADLADRVIAHVQRSAQARPTVIRLARWLVPAAAAAAAAAIVIAVVLGLTGRPGPAPEQTPVAEQRPPAETDTTAAILAEASPEVREGLVEEFAIRKLDMLRDYEVVSNFELLAAIEEVESEGGGI